jgi:hypothetical protein
LCGADAARVLKGGGNSSDPLLSATGQPREVLPYRPGNSRYNGAIAAFFTHTHPRTNHPRRRHRLAKKSTDRTVLIAPARALRTVQSKPLLARSTPKCALHCDVCFLLKNTISVNSPGGVFTQNIKRVGQYFGGKQGYNNIITSDFISRFFYADSIVTMGLMGRHFTIPLYYLWNQISFGRFLSRCSTRGPSQ